MTPSVEHEWNRYRRQALGDTPPATLAGLHHAFFAGAIVMYRILMFELANADDAARETGEAALVAELKEFAGRWIKEKRVN